MNELHAFIAVRPEELIDALADAPRAGAFPPSPEEVQELLAQVHADMGDRDPSWSSDNDELPW